MATHSKVQDIISLLKEQKPFLKEKYKIKEIGVFGSFTEEKEKTQTG